MSISGGRYRYYGLLLLAVVCAQIVACGSHSTPKIAPAITSANSTTFAVGAAGTFNVTATGTPAPTLTQTGALPAGVTFAAATGILSGTPAGGSAGAYPLVITATNSAGTATQNFTLKVGTAPAFTSANNVAFAVGAAGTFTVTATGTPAPTFAQTGALPTGVTFDTATGILSGTPAGGTSGAYPLVITATNIIGTATQNFTLTVGIPPVITSASSTTFVIGTAGTFTVTATGTPAPTLAQTGVLPTGVTFDTATGILSGTPAVGPSGAYPLVITATNTIGTATQNFTLTVSSGFAYVTNSNSNNISAYSVDPITGALTPVAGSPFAAGSEPNSVGIHPSGRFLYV